MKMKFMVAAVAGIVSVAAAPTITSAGSGGKQQFLLNSPEGSTTTTITATGVFNGVGEDIVVDESFNAGRNGRFTFTSEDEFVFDEGTLFVSITGRGRETFDEENCAGSSSGKATYDITGGTGVFDGADGRGRATFDLAFAGEKDENGECIEDDSSGVFFAKLTGKLKLTGSSGS